MQRSYPGSLHRHLFPLHVRTHTFIIRFLFQSPVTPADLLTNLHLLSCRLSFFTRRLLRGPPMTAGARTVAANCKAGHRQRVSTWPQPPPPRLHSRPLRATPPLLQTVVPNCHASCLAQRCTELLHDNRVTLYCPILPPRRFLLLCRFTSTDRGTAFMPRAHPSLAIQCIELRATERFSSGIAVHLTSRGASFRPYPTGEHENGTSRGDVKRFLGRQCTVTKTERIVHFILQFNTE